MKELPVKMPPNSLSRREFFEGLLAGAFAFWNLRSLPPLLLAAEEEKSTVVVARSDRLVNGGVVLREEAKRLVDEALGALVGEKPSSAWKSLFGPKDVVAIKVNCLGKSTSVAIAEAIAEGIESAGVNPSNIIIWDRTDRELKAAGYRLNTSGSGVRVYGTDNPSAGGYSSRILSAGSVGSLMSKIVAEKATALVSVPVLKDHDLAGVSIGMKNFFGAIHNPNKYHADHCDPFVAELHTHPLIRGKLRLTVCDASSPQAQGGPAFEPQWMWPYGGVIVSTDPVALDAVGTNIIESRRKEVGLKSLEEEGRFPTYLATAERLGLGIADSGRISAIEI